MAVKLLAGTQRVLDGSSSMESSARRIKWGDQQAGRSLGAGNEQARLLRGVVLGAFSSRQQ